MAIPVFIMKELKPHFPFLFGVGRVGVGYCGLWVENSYRLAFAHEEKVMCRSLMASSCLPANLSSFYVGVLNESSWAELLSSYIARLDSVHYVTRLALSKCDWTCPMSSPSVGRIEPTCELLANFFRNFIQKTWAACKPLMFYYSAHARNLPQAQAESAQVSYKGLAELSASNYIFLSFLSTWFIVILTNKD